MTNTSPKSYFQVNREEQFFCMLLAHCLLSGDHLRQGFAGLFSDTEKLQEVFLDYTNFEVYVEVAALRDYWRSLGDPRRYDESTEQARYEFLEKALKWANNLEPKDGQAASGWSGIPNNLLEKKPGSPFWTVGKADRYTRKLWSPARWSTKALAKYAPSITCIERLKRLRWSFNAKPDILILTGRGGILIEAKVESGGGSNKEGYRQLETQKAIIDLWQHLGLPGLDSNISLVTLGSGGKPVGSDYHLTWREVVEGMGTKNMDTFTKTCFKESIALGLKN